MMPRDLPDLANLAAVVRAGSFVRAAGELALTRSALSHSISQLERRLGIRLLNRTTRSVTPTAAGEQLLASLAPALDAIRESLDALTQLRDRPAGRLRVTLPRVAASLVVAPALGRFTKAHPDIDLELSIDDATVDIVASRFDAGIRFHERLAPDMIAVPISKPVAFAVVGAPTYFADRPLPASPHDLMDHACIRYRLRGSGQLFDWEFEREGAELAVAVSGPLTLDSPEFMIRAALDGIGLAYVPLGDVQGLIGEGRLIRVLEDWCPATARLYLYHASGRLVSRPLRAFIDWLRTCMAEKCHFDQTDIYHQDTKDTKDFTKNPR